MCSDKPIAAVSSGMAVLQVTPARTLREVSRVATVQPLDYGDPRYVDLTPGHGSNAMKLLRLRLSQIAEDGGDRAGGRWSKMIFTGHRGCGKTTELRRVEHDFADRFYPLHLELDENLLEDFDYTLLLLWLTEFIVSDFHAKGRPLDVGLVDDVARWFENKTQVQIDDESLRQQLQAGGEAKVGGTIAGLFGLKLFARMKSEVTGSLQRREEITRTLQRFARELIEKVNLLLEHAERTLRQHNLPGRLLIVHDNLDRLKGDRARILFEEYGDLLRQLSAHMIFTAPISLKLAPFNLGTVFPDVYTMPMVKVVERESGAPNEAGLTTLQRLLDRRVDCGAVFADENARTELCRGSGGSVRDLVRLLSNAADHAQVDEKNAIDVDSVTRAINGMRNEYMRILIPERLYYGRLARIHLHRNDGYGGDAGADAGAAQKERAFFIELLLNGAVLEYNGDEPWYDVHPAVQRIRAFQHAVDTARTSGP